MRFRLPGGTEITFDLKDGHETGVPGLLRDRTTLAAAQLLMPHLSPVLIVAALGLDPRLLDEAGTDAA
ncbi:hypothetical protein [Streptomyces sp. RFCAC02]|uniref:hypothetical protein n=1 Tax=Streptomyces sp. RFCAC02 TaxID=2499143 RepID=UPI0010227C9B|nr:hypothetical protein [Streptomyces sp. RFCAC02]